MFTLLNHVLRDESGQDLAEYGIAISVVAVVVITAALALRADVTTLWTSAQTAIAGAV